MNLKVLEAGITYLHAGSILAVLDDGVVQIAISARVR